MQNPSGSNRFLALTPQFTRPQYIYTRSLHGLPYPWNEQQRVSQCSKQTLRGSWSSLAGSAVKPVANLPTRFLTVLVSSQHSELSCRSPRSNTCSGKRLTEKGGGGLSQTFAAAGAAGGDLAGVWRSTDLQLESFVPRHDEGLVCRQTPRIQSILVIHMTQKNPV
jgi:hypothetical protein